MTDAAVQPFVAHRVLLVAAAVGLACLPLVAALPQSTVLWRLLHDSAHAPVFGALAVVLLALGRRAGPHYLSRDYGRALVLAIGIGAAIELIQIPIGRDAEWVDLARDALGAVTGLGAAAWIGWRRGDHVRWRRAAGVAAVLASCVLAAPLIWTLAAYAERHRQWPVVADFDSVLDLAFVQCDHGTRCTRDQWQQQPVLRVVLGGRQYAGPKFIEPESDWRGYDRLQVDLVNPESVPFWLNLRVHDRRHNQAYADRYNQRFLLPPGELRFEVPLERIATAPRGRRMDLAAIQALVVFVDSRQRGRTFLIRRMALAPAIPTPPDPRAGPSGAAGGPGLPPAGRLQPIRPRGRPA